MTCHVAFSSDAGTIMFSDSQFSTDKAEYHGYQKQFVGNDFLLGGSGHGLVVEEVFRSLKDPATGTCTADCTTVSDHIIAFLKSRVSARAAAATSFILACPDNANIHSIKILQPSIFSEFISKGRFAVLGSGADLVEPAYERDRMLGLFRQPRELVDMVVTGENYLEAATQSLTVDAQFTVGLLRSKSAYLMGDAAIEMQYAPPPVVAKWAEASKRYEEIIAHAQQIRGEIREAQRVLSLIQVAQVDKAAIAAIVASQSSVEQNRQELQAKIEDYVKWYDGIVGRKVV